MVTWPFQIFSCIGIDSCFLADNKQFSQCSIENVHIIISEPPCLTMSPALNSVIGNLLIICLHPVTNKNVLILLNFSISVLICSITNRNLTNMLGVFFTVDFTISLALHRCYLMVALVTGPCVAADHYFLFRYIFCHFSDSSIH